MRQMQGQAFQGQIVPGMFHDAIRHYQAGRPAEAERGFHAVLALQPRHADSLHLIGLIACQNGRFETAVEFIGRAIRVVSDNPSYHFSMGNALAAQGKVSDAAARYRQVLRLNPNFAEAHNNLGVLLAGQNKYEDAAGHYRHALLLKPDYADAYGNLGIVLAAQGKYAEAIDHYERASTLAPGRANTHNNLGAALKSIGRASEARMHFERALAIQPDHAEAHNNLGIILGELGNHEDAGKHYRQAVLIRPEYADAHSNLGMALTAQGKFAEAITHCERACTLDPGHANAHNNLGAALKAQGRSAEAMLHYARALAIQPDFAEAHNNLGILLSEQGRLDDAIAHYLRAVTVKPDYADAYNNLGSALFAKGNGGDAITCYQRAITINSGHAEAHNNLGNAFCAQGRSGEGRRHYEHAISIRPDYAEAHSNLGIALAAEGLDETAIAHCLHALSANPNQPEAHNSLGNIFMERGDLEKASAHYEQAISIRPDYAEAHYNRSAIKTCHPGDADLTVLEDLLANGHLPDHKALYIHFALAKAFEDSKDYERAFQHMVQGNDLKRRQILYDETVAAKLFEDVAMTFDKSLCARYQGEGDPSRAPIFVLGMPRSGSTLIEQILASHPQIQGGGELMAFESAIEDILRTSGASLPYPDCVPGLDSDALAALGRAYLGRLPALEAGKTFITNKLPANFLYIGLIRLALPNAKIIHTMRDPVDTCVSCYSKLFTAGVPYSYDLGELGRCYRRYQGMMNHWRSVLPEGTVLDVSYEDVVDDIEGQARRMIEHCGLPWDNRCVSFHNSKRPVKTASAAQVRKPLFRTSMQRWRKYESGLAPLLSELGDSANRPVSSGLPNIGAATGA